MNYSQTSDLSPNTTVVDTLDIDQANINNANILNASIAGGTISNVTLGNDIAANITSLTTPTATITNATITNETVSGTSAIESLTANTATITNETATNSNISTANVTNLTVTNTIVGNAATANTATSATTATNISGGTKYNIPVQTAASTTSFIDNGTVGQLLQSNGIDAAPSWINPSGLSAENANNISGGAAGQLLYQSATNVTSKLSGYTFICDTDSKLAQWATDSQTTKGTGYASGNDYTNVLIANSLSISSANEIVLNLSNCETISVRGMPGATITISGTYSGVQKGFAYSAINELSQISNIYVVHTNSLGATTLSYCNKVSKVNVTTGSSSGLAVSYSHCASMNEDYGSATATSSTAGSFDSCTNIGECVSLATGSQGYGYMYCVNVGNCTDNSSTTYGAFTCTKVINFIGTTNTCTADIGTLAGVTTTIGNTTDAANNTFYGNATTATTAVNVNDGTINATTGTFSGTVTAPTSNGALSGNATTANVTGTMPIGANYIQYYSSTYPATNVTPSSLFGGTWEIIALSNITTL